MAMTLADAIGTVYNVMTVIGQFETRPMVGGRHTKCFFLARCTYKVDGENKTEDGQGSLTLIGNEEDGFDPVRANFWTTDGTELEWLWHQHVEEFKLVEEKNETATPVGTTDGESSS